MEEMAFSREEHTRAKRSALKTCIQVALHTHMRAIAISEKRGYGFDPHCILSSPDLEPSMHQYTTYISVC